MIYPHECRGMGSLRRLGYSLGRVRRRVGAGGMGFSQNGAGRLVGGDQQSIG
jgi:hypothetical protein